MLGCSWTLVSFFLENRPIESWAYPSPAVLLPIILKVLEGRPSFLMSEFEEIRRDRDLYFGDFPSQEQFDREIEKNTA